MSLLNTMDDETLEAASLFLIQEVLSLREQRWIDPNKILSFPGQFNITSDEGKIYFLRELHGIVRRLPEKIHKSSEDRERLLTALQQALDAAVDQEDA